MQFQNFPDRPLGHEISPIIIITHHDREITNINSRLFVSLVNCNQQDTPAIFLGYFSLTIIAFALVAYSGLTALRSLSSNRDLQNLSTSTEI